jgi:hypothetical protein
MKLGLSIIYYLVFQYEHLDSRYQHIMLRIFAVFLTLSRKVTEYHFQLEHDFSLHIIFNRLLAEYSNLQLSIVCALHRER